MAVWLDCRALTEIENKYLCMYILPYQKIYFIEILTKMLIPTPITIWSTPKNSKPHYSIALATINLQAKYEVCISIHCLDFA